MQQAEGTEFCCWTAGRRSRSRIHHIHQSLDSSKCVRHFVSVRTIPIAVVGLVALRGHNPLVPADVLEGYPQGVPAAPRLPVSLHTVMGLLCSLLPSQNQALLRVHVQWGHEIILLHTRDHLSSDNPAVYIGEAVPGTWSTVDELDHTAKVIVITGELQTIVRLWVVQPLLSSFSEVKFFPPRFPERNNSRVHQSFSRVRIPWMQRILQQLIHIDSHSGIKSNSVVDSQVLRLDTELVQFEFCRMYMDVFVWVWRLRYVHVEMKPQSFVLRLTILHVAPMPRVIDICKRRNKRFQCLEKKNLPMFLLGFFHFDSFCMTFLEAAVNFSRTTQLTGTR